MIVIKISALGINSLARSFHPPCHSLLFFGIICGPICGSLAVLVSFAAQFGDRLLFWDHLWSWNHLWSRTDLLVTGKLAPNITHSNSALLSGSVTSYIFHGLTNYTFFSTCETRSINSYTLAKLKTSYTCT